MVCHIQGYETPGMQVLREGEKFRRQGVNKAEEESESDG